MTAKTELLDAIDQYNRTQIAEFQLETGLRYLGDDGPIYLAGAVRIRALFVDPQGRHYCDVGLAIESTHGDPVKREAYRDWIGGECIEPGHGLLLHTQFRGHWDATILLVADVADRLDLPEPELFPPGWARTWSTIPTLTDGQELTMVAHGWDHSGDGL